MRHRGIFWLGLAVVLASMVFGMGSARSSEEPTRIYGSVGTPRITPIGTAINNFAAFLVKCTGDKTSQGAMHSLSVKKEIDKDNAEVVQVVFACFPKKGKQTAKK